MREIRMSGLMSGEGKRDRPNSLKPRPSSTLHERSLVAQPNGMLVNV